MLITWDRRCGAGTFGRCGAETFGRCGAGTFGRCGGREPLGDVGGGNLWEMWGAGTFGRCGGREPLGDVGSDKTPLLNRYKITAATFNTRRDASFVLFDGDWIERPGTGEGVSGDVGSIDLWWIDWVLYVLRAVGVDNVQDTA